jgi:sialate O-acetylesterase
LLTRFAIPLVFCLAAYPQEVRIASGLADHQVIQRGPDGTGSVRLSGPAPGGAVEVRYVPEGGVPGRWTTLASAQNGRFSGDFKGIPAGGPYTIEVRAGGATAAMNDVFVGDLWILAGQSNMEGVGDLVDVEKPDPMVHTFDMFDHWDIAKEPLHNLPGAVDRVHWRKNAQGEPERLTGDALAKFNENRKKGAGLGLPFAVEMVRRTGIPVGLAPCAHGGTSMDQWSPALKDKGGDSLYGAMLRRFQAVGGRVTGVLWYQGESDANPKAAPLFAEKFEKLISSVREDFGQKDLPFYFVQIGRHVDKSNIAEWNAVQEYQRLAERNIPHSGMVAAIDVALDDGIHVSTQDQKRVGRRLAILATRDLFANVSYYGRQTSGPRPASATFSSGILTLTFDGVNGRLQSAGRISGFTIHDAAGAPVPMIYKARFDPAQGNVVYLHLGGKLPEGATLRYGFGKDPYCNVTDSMDMGLPVFGPMAIAQ